MDGSITFKTKLDTKELKQQLNDLKAEVKEFDQQLSSYEKQKAEKTKYLKANGDRYESEKAIYGDKDSDFTREYEGVLDKVIAIEEAEKNLHTTREENLSTIQQIEQEIATANAQEEQAKAKTKEVKKATKNLVKQFTSLGTILKGRLKRQLISGLVNSISTGFNTLLKYSPQLKSSFNSMKNSLAQLGGSLVSTFAPLIQQLIPIFTKIIDFINKIAVAVSKMIAVLTGKNSIYKAIKGQKDYAKALNGTNKALASFDEINQLSNNDESALSFTEESIGTDEAERIKQILGTILPLITAIGTALALLNLNSVLGLSAKELLGISLIVGGITALVIGIMDVLENGLTLENLGEILLGVGLVLGGLLLLLGPTALAIGVIVAGIVLLVLAISDAIEKGEMSDEALLAITIALLAIGTVVALLTGSWIPLAIAGIAMLVALIAKHWDSIKEKTAELWENIKQGFKDGVNKLIGYVESFVNGFIDARNKIADALNSIQIDVPSWVPGIGGKTIGFNIAKKEHITIPRLATGTVVPPNAGEFLAMLGDNKNDTEIVSPLETMKQAMIEALQSQGNNITIKFDGNLSQLARYLKPAIDKENTRVGTSLVVGG